LESRVVQVLKQYRLALDAGEQNIMADMGIRWLQIEARLKTDIFALSEEMVRRTQAGEVITEQIIRKAERYKVLERQMAAEIAKYNKDFAAEYIAAAQKEYAALGIKAAQDAIVTSYMESGMVRAFDRIYVDAVQSMIGFAGDGSPLKTLLMKDYVAPVADEVVKSLINGIARGQGVAQTARDIQNSMGMGLDRSLLIAKTETGRAYRSASTQQYRESGVVKKFRRLVKKETACLGCLFLDGEVLNTEDEMEDHPGGFCTVLCEVEGVPPPEWEQGKDWFDGLDEDQQQQILGAERFDLWKNGGISLDNMAGKTHSDTWGDASKVKTLAELAELRK